MQQLISVLPCTGIDYAAIHLWPDNWKRLGQEFGNIWLTNHSANGQLLNKPVVLEEFGKVGGLCLRERRWGICPMQPCKFGTTLFSGCH